MKNCPNCQQEITDIASFCGACGYKMEQAALGASPGAPSPSLVSPIDVKNEAKEKSKRPISITIICVIGFIGGAFSLLTFSFIRPNLANQFGDWYTLYAGITNIVTLMCMVGLWMMKKWAAYTYTAIVAIGLFLRLYSGDWHVMDIISVTNITSILISALIIFFVLKHVPKMT